jgi:hypothetical protein
MPRLWSESSRPYPGRSVQRGGQYCYGSRTEGHLERGGLPPKPTAIMAAHQVATHGVSGQKSAEVIGAQCPG